MEFFIDLLRDNNWSEEQIQALQHTFFLVLMLPLVSTIIGIFKHIVGLKGLRIYVPILLTFAFYQLGYFPADQNSNVVVGLKFGLVLYAIVFFTSTILYSTLRAFRMHYIPKATLVLTDVAIAVTAAIFIGTFIFDSGGLFDLNFLALIMIVALSDNFVSLMARLKFRKTFYRAIETLIISIVAYLIISLDVVRDLTFEYAPIYVIVILIFNIYLGRFVGLRLSEYWRFRQLLFAEEINTTNAKPKSNTKK